MGHLQYILASASCDMTGALANQFPNIIKDRPRMASMDMVRPPQGPD